MDKSVDVFVLFYKPSTAFCAAEGATYGAYAAESAAATPSVLALRMDVSAHKSPFVFEDDELPVIMLFPAKDKRPLEFDKTLTTEELRVFAIDNGSTLDDAEEGAAAEGAADA